MEIGTTIHDIINIVSLLGLAAGTSVATSGAGAEAGQRPLRALARLGLDGRGVAPRTHTAGRLRPLPGLPASGAAAEPSVALTGRCSRRQGHVDFQGFVAHSAPAAAEMGR